MKPVGPVRQLYARVDFITPVRDYEFGYTDPLLQLANVKIFQWQNLHLISLGYFIQYFILRTYLLYIQFKN